MKSRNLRKYIFIEIVILPVEISATEAGAEVSRHHSVRVEHGHNVKDK
jgi:hypothetical protein